MAPDFEPAEIAGSLMIDEIPVKLRCAACDKLAINAFRMPCCDQSICEECQASLPQACPVCLHEPVNKDDCRPNKALRTTIKVFLKKKGVEREGLRKKELLVQAAATPSTPVTLKTDDTSTHQRSPSLVVSASEPLSGKPIDSSDSGQAPSGVDVPQQSIESPGPPEIPRRASTQAAGEENLAQDTSTESQRVKNEDEGKIENMPVSQNNVPTAGDRSLGLDPNASFPNMTNMSMDQFNPMLQLLQGGMPNNMLGQFPNMMGLPGMGMDPMAMSQGMFGNFGGPGIGVNGMNMGMGFDAGQNAYGGFNGQPQNFNQSQYNGHANGMGGSFVANSSYGGNNMPQHQGSFNQMHQHQNFNNDFQHGYHNQGFHNRGRGRGRGAFFNAGRGRGYVPPAHQGRQAVHDQAFQNQVPDQTNRRGSPVYTPMQGSESEQQSEQVVDTEASGKVDDEEMKRRDEAQFNKELEPGDAEESVEVLDAPVGGDRMEVNKEQPDSERVPSEQQPEADSVSLEESKPRPIQSVVSDESVGTAVSHEVNTGPVRTAMPPPNVLAIPTGPSKHLSGVSIPATSPRGRGFGRGFSRGFPDFRSVPRGRGSVPPIDNSAHNYSSSSVDSSFHAPTVSKGLGVEGAPTGPKALRQGASNAGPKPPPQDAGFSIMGRANAQARPNGSVKSPSGKEPLPRSRSRSRSRSGYRSPVHAASSGDRHVPRSSVSPQPEPKRDKRRDRHEHSPRRGSEYYEDSQGFRGSRARDDSTHSSPQRSRRRSHRDHDKESSRNKHRSHRSHRNRTRSPEGQRRSSRNRSRTPELRISGASKRTHDDNSYKEKHEDEGRSSRKRRERDDDERGSDRKRSRRHEEPATNEQEQNHRRKHGHRKEQDSRRESKARERPDESRVDPPKSPKVDQHALEREARNRERQMKEIQRRAVMEGKTSSSKGRTNGRAGERRASYKYEDEDLTSRVEKERESNRWG